MIIPIILAGGSGTRLWPLSRKTHPKQFISLLNETSLFQDTLTRLPKEALDPIVICNEDHRFLVAEQAREINVTLNSIILEPIGRNTAPAILASALIKDISNEQPKVLTTSAVEQSDVVITMGCGDACPFFPGKRYLDWVLPDPAGQGVADVRPIRDQIKKLVEELIPTLFESN